LLEPYLQVTDRKLATITGFALGCGQIPDFNQENAFNGSLEEYAKITYINRC
jgi:hypothetical protein